MDSDGVEFGASNDTPLAYGKRASCLNLYHDASLLHHIADTSGVIQEVTSGLNLNDLVSSSRTCRFLWSERRRWRIALAAARDTLWASLALDDCSADHSGCMMFCNCRRSLASEEALRCSERCELQGGRATLLRAIEALSLSCLQSGKTSVDCGTFEARPAASVALIRRIAQRQAWRLLEVDEDEPLDRSHPISVLLRQSIDHSYDSLLETALEALTDPGVLEKASIQRERLLIHGPASCPHRATCANNCGRTESYQGQFAQCPLCKEATYCSEKCRIDHWLAGHRAVCSGVFGYAPIVPNSMISGIALGTTSVAVATTANVVASTHAISNRVDTASAAEDTDDDIDPSVATVIRPPLPSPRLLLPPPEPVAIHTNGGTHLCAQCARERRELLDPYVGVVNRVLGGAWGDWHALGVWPRQPPAVLALAAAASELLAAAAGEPRLNGRPRCILEAWSEFRQRAARDAQALVARLRSFVDAIAAGTVPTWVFRHAEARARQELGPDKDAWPVAARRVAPVGARAVEALAGWLAAVLRAAAVAPPLPPRPRLRTLANYRSPDAEFIVTAACHAREVSPSLVRMLGRLNSFITIPSGVLLQHICLGGKADNARLLLQQPWMPKSGLDATLLKQVCAIETLDAPFVEDLIDRTMPDGVGFRALWSRAGSAGALGRAVRAATERWVNTLPHEEIVASVHDTPLEIPELSCKQIEQENANDLDSLVSALTAAWLDGLLVHKDTAQNVYSKRPLTAASVHVLRLATRGLEPEMAEMILAEVDRPCLAWHDSRGVAALLEWLGRGPLPGGNHRDQINLKSKGEVAFARPLLVRLLHGILQTEQITKNDASALARRNPLEHSRASVEAVECLLSACPRLARSLLPLEQLSPAFVPCALASDGLLVASGIQGGPSNTGGPGGSNESTSTVTSAGRLLPIQTLCICCGETPNTHTAALARALLRRSPEAGNQPLPRALRRNARGRRYDVFVCTAATALQLRCLAAEEAKEDKMHAQFEVTEDEAGASALTALWGLRDIVAPGAQSPSVASLSLARPGPTGAHFSIGPPRPALPPPSGSIPLPPLACTETTRGAVSVRTSRGVVGLQSPGASQPTWRSPRRVVCQPAMPQAPLSARAPHGSPLPSHPRSHTESTMRARGVALPAIRAR